MGEDKRKCPHLEFGHCREEQCATCDFYKDKNRGDDEFKKGKS